VVGKFYAGIVKMAEKKDMRGKGIGKAIIERLIEGARKMDADGIWIETSDRPATGSTGHGFSRNGPRRFLADAL